MRYSVYNFGKAAFDYYEDNRVPTGQNAPKPGHLVNRTLGSTIEQAAWPLPADAKFVGSGTAAIGRVASKGGGGGALGDALLSSPLAKAGALLVSAILAYKYLLPRKYK